MKLLDPALACFHGATDPAMIRYKDTAYRILLSKVPPSNKLSSQLMTNRQNQQHVGSRDHPSLMKEGVVLVTQFFISEKPEVLSNIIETLRRNLENPFITEILLLNEQDYDFSQFNNNYKINQIIIGERLTFKKAFEIMNMKYYNNRKVILANADIYFDETLQLLYHYNFSSKSIIFALLKWANVMENVTLSLRTDSQDAWIFQTPLHTLLISEYTDFPLGAVRCDNRLAKLLKELNYNVIGPVFAIHAIEFNTPLKRSLYDYKRAVSGDTDQVLLTIDL